MKLRRLLLILLLAAPFLVGLSLVGWQSAEQGLVNRATAQFQAGEWEASLNSLATLQTRPLLSSAGRRRAAELFLRMGEDAHGHALLKGQRFDEQDPEDQKLRELTSRCVRAARLVEKADKSRDPAQRLEYLRAAQLELPDAPRLLQRVTLEELGALTRARSPEEAAELSDAYLQDYAALRQKAPTLAAEVRRRHEALQARVEN